MFFEHDNGDENASKKPPQTVARKCCQLSAATTRTRIGPLKRTCNCYTLLYIVGLSPLEQQSWTCILYFGSPYFGWFRHYSLETQKAHLTPRTEITNYISMHRRHFSAPGARNREIVLFSPEYRIFFCANQCQMQWSKIDTQVYVLLYSTSNDALNRKEKHTYSNNECGSGNLIRRLLIVRFYTILF